MLISWSLAMSSLSHFATYFMHFLMISWFIARSLLFLNLFPSASVFLLNGILFISSSLLVVYEASRIKCSPGITVGLAESFLSVVLDIFEKVAFPARSRTQS